MSVRARLSWTAALVVGVLIAVIAVVVAVSEPKGMAEVAGQATPPTAAPVAQAVAASAPLPGGLAVSDAGYTLVPVKRILPLEEETTFRFAVVGPDGKPVRQYRTLHEKLLHLIVVRRDFILYQHLHPTMDDGGIWSIGLTLGSPGTYRMFVDTAPVALKDRASLTLGVDLFVAGEMTPIPFPRADVNSHLTDMDVVMTADPKPGEGARFTFTMTSNGRPVTDLEPYLGAFGHLVLLREGDMAYLHVHPTSEAAPGSTGGPQVQFSATLPTAGRYAAFLDFQRQGEIHHSWFYLDILAQPGVRPERQEMPGMDHSGH